MQNSVFRRVSRSLILLMLACSFAQAEKVHFNRDIRPIFTKHCTPCHGGVKAAGKISLIYREIALSEGKSGEICIVPGAPEASELMRRITATDPDEVMPKPKHSPPLVPEDVAKIREWIKQGAEWEELWSFTPPRQVPLPKLNDPSWPKSPLDHWVLAKMEELSLRPTTEADKAEWLRRASLDLTGLPPSPEEWQLFAADDSPQCFENAANRLLDSPHFGERWAVMWMDLARYSDTKGFEKDPARTVWPYRDWLIRAFNADLPYDQFTIKQIAGDLLEKPSADDLLATVFHRNTQSNTEGGTDDEEFRTAAVIDRTNTTWTTWQATTFACVQCHSHPYDPFPHEDYYRFMAFFDNTEDCDIDSDFPLTKITNDPAQQLNAVQWEKELSLQRRAINDNSKSIASSLQGLETPRALNAISSAPTGKIEQKDDGYFYSSGTNPTVSSYTLRYPMKPFSAIRLDILPESDDPKKWSALAAVCGEFQMHRIKADGTKEKIAFKEVIADSIAGPFDPNEAIRPGGSGFGDYPAQRGPRWCVFVPEQPVGGQPEEQWEITLHHSISCNADNQPSILKKFQLRFSNDPSLQQHVLSAEHKARWQKHNILKRNYDALRGNSVPVIRERSPDARRDTRVFARGNRMTKDRSVQPGIPEISRPPQLDRALSRLDLAHWLVGEENTLTARVLANRLWAELFGIGLVETLEDFGSSGLPPSNQELLDHLALRLSQHHKWHIKPFLREIVLSATYRQSAKASAEHLAKDPRNVWLTRGPRQRLTAEMVRDQSLLVSGLLSHKSFGPPVFPPQPEGIWKSVYNGAKWTTSQGEDRYRRAIYTFSKRTSGYPSTLTFDAPARDVCSPRRINSNTPLQALVTLNDPAFMEMAAAFANRMKQSASDLPTQLRNAHHWLTLQNLPPSALQTLLQLHADAVAEYRMQPDEMKILAATPEDAAMILVANTMLNLDSALNR
jgi:hypothetical protein